MKKIKDLWDLLEALEEKGEKLAIFSSCGDSDFLDEEISFVWELLEKEHGLESSDDTTDIFYAFGDGEITKKQAQNQLKKLAKKK